MQIRYSLLFSVGFRHDYFPQGNCPVVGLFPTRKTAGIMQRLGIRMKVENFKSSFYYQDGGAAPAELLLMNETIGPTFVLRTTDQLFRNYTQPEAGKKDTDPTFLTNLGTDGLSEGLATDLPANWEPGDLGLLTIFVGETGAGSRLVADGVVTPEAYTISFTVRESIWRYYVVNSSEPGNNNFELVDNASGAVVSVAGNPPRTKILRNGTEAVVLLAASSFPLHLRPAARFTLHVWPTDAEQSEPLKVPLPSAVADPLSADSPEGPFYSDLYVYV